MSKVQKRCRNKISSASTHRSLIRVGNLGLIQLHTARANLAMEKPVESTIRKKLTDAFQPKVLEVINESYMHNVPKGSESHFKVVVVSDKFDSQSLIKRHRMVNEVLQLELKEQVHALSILAKTPEQWANSEQNIVQSPPCRGGAGL